MTVGKMQCEGMADFEKIEEALDAAESGKKIRVSGQYNISKDSFIQKRLTWAPPRHMSDHDQNYLLIKEVKLHPCLYDPEHEKFKNSKHKNKIWAEIKGKLNCNNNLEKITSAKGRFTSLYKKFSDVCVFMFIADEMETNSEPSRKFHYYEEMEFLIKYMKREMINRSFKKLCRRTSQNAQKQKRPAEDSENSPPRKIMKTSSPQEFQDAESPAPSPSQSVQINSSDSEVSIDVENPASAPDLPRPEDKAEPSAELPADNKESAEDLTSKSGENDTQDPDEVPELPSQIPKESPESPPLYEQGGKHSASRPVNSYEIRMTSAMQEQKIDLFFMSIADAVKSSRICGTALLVMQTKI